MDHKRFQLLAAITDRLSYGLPIESYCDIYSYQWHYIALLLVYSEK